MNICFLGHVEHENGGRFERAAHERGAAVQTFQATHPEALGAAAKADLLVVLGGPMGVYEADRYPFLRDELGMLQERLRAKKPVVGVCLGAQLLAAAAGARVYKGDAGFEVGFGELKRAPGAETHPWGRRLPESFPVLHWHGDTFTLPEGAALLASSERYPNQIFALGRHALGLQCHLEVAAVDLPGFVGGNGEDLRPGTGVTRESILAQGAAMDTRIDPVFQGLWRGIVTVVGGS